ncbi:MAG: hypothetical protein WCJ81_01320 [bacterium]
MTDVNKLYTSISNAGRGVFQKQMEDDASLVWRIFRQPLILDELTAKVKALRASDITGNPLTMGPETISLYREFLVYAIVGLIQLKRTPSLPPDPSQNADLFLGDYDVILEDCREVFNEKIAAEHKGWREMPLSQVTDLMQVDVKFLREPQYHAVMTVESIYEDLIVNTVLALLLFEEEY